MFGNGTQYTLPEWINDLSIEDAVKLLLLGFFGTTAPSGGGGGLPVVPTATPVTRHSVLLSASAQAIPTGARGYGFTVITGTASDGTASGLPAGFSQSDDKTLAAGFTVTAAAASTCFVYWNT